MKISKEVIETVTITLSMQEASDLLGALQAISNINPDAPTSLEDLSNALKDKGVKLYPALRVKEFYQPSR